MSSRKNVENALLICNQIFLVPESRKVEAGGGGGGEEAREGRGERERGVYLSISARFITGSCEPNLRRCKQW